MGALVNNSVYNNSAWNTPTSPVKRSTKKISDSDYQDKIKLLKTNNVNKKTVKKIKIDEGHKTNNENSAPIKFHFNVYEGEQKVPTTLSNKTTLHNRNLKIKKAIQDGDNGAIVSNTQNVYFDKPGYGVITNGWNQNINNITPAQKWPPKQGTPY